MILKASYEDESKDGSESTDFDPYFGTDVGICSLIKPQLSFNKNKSLDKLPYWTKLFGANEKILPGSEVGKANGLTVLLDAETYDYTYHLRAGEGFKVCHVVVNYLKSEKRWNLGRLHCLEAVNQYFVKKFSNGVDLNEVKKKFQKTLI